MVRKRIADITPPDEAELPEPVQEEPSDDSAEEASEESDMTEDRSLRSIRPSATRMRLTPTMHQRPEPRFEERNPRRGRVGLLVAGVAAVIMVGGVGALLTLGSTDLIVTPRTQTVTFDASSPFTAYPAATASLGTIPYTVATQSFEDSAVVEASGVEQAEEKATGKVMVYNAHSDKPVELIKNTRFETPDGKVFRIPASIMVPGKSGDAPGSIETDVFADATGPDYNVGPFEKLTIPGLKSSPDMYAGVYAKSSAAFNGGFSGQRPAVTPAVLDAARAEVRNRLNEKSQEFVRGITDGLAFPGLAAISYETLTPTEEGAGKVRIHEKATIGVPVFSPEAFSQAVAQSVSANAEGVAVVIRFADGVAAQPAMPLSTGMLGTQPITFTLGGRGQLIWEVDGRALVAAVAGREESAFETIVQSFPSVEEARARIMPFWRTSFPSDEADIEIKIQDPVSF